MLITVPIGSLLAQGLEKLGLDCICYETITALYQKLPPLSNHSLIVGISFVMYGKTRHVLYIHVFVLMQATTTMFSIATP